jgi:U3 small nucleolar RNA-associated protein 11
VHIKDRGNVALPTDIVKVLKTQDENYIRTVRTAGLKVCSASCAIPSYSITSQKIDKLKRQLTSLADLIKPTKHHDNVQDNLNDEEFQLLREAGIISGSKKSGRKPKHIVFVDGADEGMFFFVQLAS